MTAPSNRAGKVRLTLLLAANDLADYADIRHGGMLVRGPGKPCGAINCPVCTAIKFIREVRAGRPRRTKRKREKR